MSKRKEQDQENHEDWEPTDELRGGLAAFAQREGLLVPATDAEVQRYEAGTEPEALDPLFMAKTTAEILRRIRAGDRPPVRGQELPRFGATASLRRAASRVGDEHELLEKQDADAERGPGEELDQPKG